MRFLIKKAAFQTALDKAGATVSSKDNDALLKSFNIQADEDQIRILSTDLSLGSIAKIRVADIKDTGAICVPAQKLTSIVRSAQDGDIEFEVQENQAVLKAGRTTWQINVLDAETFPAVPVFGTTNEGDQEPQSVNREKLLDVIAKVRYAASTDEVRAALMLIAFNGERAAASDGHRLQVAEFKGLDGVQIPINAVNNLVRLLNRTEVEDIKVQVKKNHLLFQIGADTFSTGRLFEDFPDVEKMILAKAETNKRELTIDKKALIEAVERVRIASDEDRKQLTIEVLESGNGTGPEEIILKAVDPNGELAQETLPCTTVDLDAGRQIIVNHQYFMDALAMNKSAQVTLKLGDDAAKRRSPIYMHEAGLKSVVLQLRPEDTE
jgi:DNA polymerase III beta subunit